MLYPGQILFDIGQDALDEFQSIVALPKRVHAYIENYTRIAALQTGLRGSTFARDSGGLWMVGGYSYCQHSRREHYIVRYERRHGDHTDFGPMRCDGTPILLGDFGCGAIFNDTGEIFAIDSLHNREVIMQLRRGEQIRFPRRDGRYELVVIRGNYEVNRMAIRPACIHDSA